MFKQIGTFFNIFMVFLYSYNNAVLFGDLIDKDSYKKARTLINAGSHCFYYSAFKFWNKWSLVHEAPLV